MGIVVLFPSQKDHCAHSLKHLEVLSLDYFRNSSHQQKFDAIRLFKDSENLQDVRMVQLNLDRKLSSERIDLSDVIGAGLLRKNFERKFLARLEVLDEVDVPGSATAKKLFHRKISEIKTWVVRT